jgi:epoxyqueuosine reductase
MENHFDKRLDTSKLVEGSKSVISLLLNYYPNELQKKGFLKISKYAYGDDYHEVIKIKLKEFHKFNSKPKLVLLMVGFSLILLQY